MDGEWVPIERLVGMHTGDDGEPEFSAWTLAQWAKAGRFAGDASKPGKKWWFRKDAIERLLAREAIG